MCCQYFVYCNMEKYKDVKGFEGHYEVSNFGNVRSIKFKTRILKPSVRKDGYVQYNLRKKGIRKIMLGHRIVAQSFLDESKKKFVNHINGNKTDNNILNLEWCTKSENTKHAIKTGLMPKKLNLKKANEIRMRSKEESRKDLALEFGVTVDNLSYIISGKTWKND